jgi:TATA-binding protein-associated factor
VREALVWNFAVLDEGHVIKNPKSKTALAVKQVGLRARHRLILTGTPIQNNVLELWGLFDFLMPSFLGSEPHFNLVYSKPILASGRDLRVNRKRFSASFSDAVASDPGTGLGAARASSYGSGYREGEREGAKDTIQAQQEAQLIEAGELALDRLHRQVLPFMLRRTKQEVLEDLPPKIIQDILCPMTPLQQALYTAYEQQTGVGAEESLVFEESPSSKALSALMYLKKLANHPFLVLGQGDGDADEGAEAESMDKGKEETKGETKVVPRHSPQHTNARALWNQYHPGRDAHDVQVAPKLQALLQLLLECGIGGDARALDDDERKREEGGGGDVGTTTVLGGSHRVLIFSQMRGMLDLVEQDVLGKHFPAVSFLRMDGSTPVHKRFQMQLDFNADPSIEVMLLTTHVGGLGLTLTGADTVVFLDHDWNPMRDLQAMDRAHRIGQTKTVNVYRLIAQGTLEERIMGLQRFKLNIANTVVSQDNAHLHSMGTSKVLDLMGARKQPADRGTSNSPGISMLRGRRGAGGLEAVERKALGDDAELDELWGEEQYAGLNLDSFMAQENVAEPNE